MISTLTGYLKYKREPKVATLKSIPIKPTAPKNGLSLLFGYRTREVMSSIFQKVRKEDYQIFNVEVLVDIGDFVPSRRDIEDLPSIYVLDLMRTKRGLTDHINEHLVKYQEQAKVKEIEQKPNDAIRKRPKLLDKLMLEPEFKHIGIVVWQPILIDDSITDSPVATILRPDDITEIRTRGCDTKITLDF